MTKPTAICLLLAAGPAALTAGCGVVCNLFGWGSDCSSLGQAIVLSADGLPDGDDARNGAEPPGADGDGDGNGDTGTTGDAAAGAVFFQEVNCGACHCSDGSGGCAASAPDIRGTSGAGIFAKISGAENHTGGIFANATQTDADNMAAFLAQ